MDDSHERRQDVRASHAAIASTEIAVTQLRFQTLTVYLAAVGFIVGLGQPRRSIGALLLVITLGLWILDLRNRDLLSLFRTAGRLAEAQMDVENDAGYFQSRAPGKVTAAQFGLLNQQIRVGAGVAGLISFQVGIDVVFFGVMGYAIRLVIGRGGWWNAVMLVPLAVAVIGALVMFAIDRRTRTSNASAAH
jgi:hypothetical protein